MPRPGFGFGERSRRPEWLLLCLAIAVLGVGLGLREPWPSDEPRFVLVAKQMWESGNWLLPMRGNEIYPDKPPLFFWLLCLAYGLTGSWRLAFLLPSLLAGLVTLALLHDLARRLYGLRAARLATLCLLFAVQFAFQVKRAQIDPLLLGLMTAAHYGLLRHLLLGPAWGWAGFGAAMAGFATIAKGVGPLSLLLLPAFVLARQLAGARLPHLRLLDRRALLLPLALLLPIAAWLVPLLLQAAGDPQRTAYVQEILFGQTAQRYLVAASHAKPFWYFGPVLLLQWLPLGLLLPWLLPAWRRRLRRRDGRLATLLLMIAMVVLFFSLSPNKRDVYVLPLLPLAVLAAAPLLPGLWRKATVQRTVGGAMLLLGLLLTLASFWAMTAEPRWAQRLVEQRGFEPWAIMLTVGLGMIAACAVAWLRRRPAAAWGLGLAWAWLVLALLAFPRLDDASSGRGVMRAAGARIGPMAELGLLHWKEQNLLQADRPVQVFGFLRNRAAQELDAVAWLRAAPERRWLLLQPLNLEACFDPARAEFVGRSNRRDWWLANAQALRPACLPHPPSALRDRRAADF